MMEAVLEVDTGCPLLIGPARDGTIAFRILDHRRAGRCGSQDLLEITGPSDTVDAYLRSLGEEHDIRVVDRMQVGADRALALLGIPGCLASCDANGANAFLVSQETNGGGTYRWRLLLADCESLEAVLRRLRRLRCGIRLIRIRRLRPSEILSARQEAILRAAWQLGYYDFPRKIRLTALAERLGLSKAALAEVLRRGEHKIVTRHFEGYMDRH